MSEWKEGTLYEVLNVVMGQSPKGDTCNSDGIGLPLLNGPTEFGIKFPTPVQFTTDAKRVSEVGDILFCVRGSTTGRMNWADQPYAIGRGIAAIQHKEGKEFSAFGRALIDYNLPLLLSSSTGSTFPNVSRSQLEKLEIFIPPKEEQKAIAAVLSSLDDKIDLPHRQNKTLEQMAETLFRQWFVEEADEGWEEGKLGELIRIGSGKALKKEKYIENGKYPILGANGEIGRTNEYLFDDRLIFTGRVGTLGNVFRVENEKVWLSDNTLVINPKKYYNFIYFILKDAQFEQYNVGSTQPLVRQSDIKEIDVILSEKTIHIKFEKQANIFFEKIKSNQTQIRTLEKMRDAILPKLMSREVTIKM